MHLLHLEKQEASRMMLQIYLQDQLSQWDLSHLLDQQNP
jgi:hypothetical protein